MYKVHRITDGWVILYQEDDTTRQIDGSKVYTKRQAAYRRCKKLNDAIKQIDEQIKRDGAIISGSVAPAMRAQ